jgi:hypothetical protein
MAVINENWWWLGPFVAGWLVVMVCRLVRELCRGVENELRNLGG